MTIVLNSMFRVKILKKYTKFSMSQCFSFFQYFNAKVFGQKERLHFILTIYHFKISYNEHSFAQ
jgi:hypothetical protein